MFGLHVVFQIRFVVVTHVTLITLEGFTVMNVDGMILEHFDTIAYERTLGTPISLLLDH